MYVREIIDKQMAVTVPSCVCVCVRYIVL